MLRDALAPLGLTVRGTDELGIVLDIEEDGATVLENARKKAQVYSQVLQRPVLSLDSALYLEGLAEDEQPGVNTRRVPHHTNRATDQELLDYYSETIKGLGG